MAAKGKTVLAALDESISAAVESGKIDAGAQAALIAVARKVAALMDKPDWPIVCKDADGKGKLDNVSPTTLLKYCEALGVCPELAPSERKAVKSRLSKMRDEVRVIKAAG